MDKDIYKNFIKNIEIADIFLSNIESKRYLALFNNDCKVDVEFKPKFEFDSIEKNKFISKSEFKVYAKIKEEKLFDIICEFTIINLITDESLMKEEFIKKYVKDNLPIIVWPYAREIINSITTRMGFPPLILANHKLIRE